MPQGYQYVQDFSDPLIALVREYAKLGKLPESVVDAVLRTKAGVRVSGFTKSGGVWRPAGPVDIAAGLPAIAHLLITVVTDATHVTVSSAVGVSEGDVMRWWDSSAGAELGDVAITDISGNDLTLAGPGIAGAAADDQAWRVADMGVWPVGDTTRDFTPGVNSKVTFPGGGMFTEQLGAGTTARCRIPFVFSSHRTAIARFASGFTIPNAVNLGVVLNCWEWTNAYAGLGSGYRATGGGTYGAAAYRGGVWTPSVAGGSPSDRRSLVFGHHNGLMSAHATFSNQASYMAAAAGGVDTADLGLEILCLGAGVSALLTGFESTSISEV